MADLIRLACPKNNAHALILLVQKMDSAIHQISIRETSCAIQGIVIYPVDIAIHLLNNWRLVVFSIKFLLVITKIRLPKMVTKTNDVNT